MDELRYPPTPAQRRVVPNGDHYEFQFWSFEPEYGWHVWRRVERNKYLTFPIEFIEQLLTEEI